MTIPHSGLKAQWLEKVGHLPPETLANFVEAPGAKWAVITEDGPPLKRVKSAAYLETPTAMPFWAFCLAKSYLDDVGEWPLYGMAAEVALDQFDDHQDPERAVREILSSVTPVWEDFSVHYVGKEQS